MVMVTSALQPVGHDTWSATSYETFLRGSSVLAGVGVPTVQSWHEVFRWDSLTGPWCEDRVTGWLTQALLTGFRRPFQSGRATLQSYVRARLEQAFDTTHSQQIETLPSREWGRVQTAESLQERAFLSVAVAFSALKSVKSVYVLRFRKDIQVFVLTAIERYDDALMDLLLEREWAIRTQYPDLFFDFTYPPGGGGALPDFIHPRARCIFSR